MAAIGIRQASAFLRLEGRRSTNTEYSNALYAAASQLSDLARQVRSKEVKSVARLDREFARAHYALAEHDYVMAKESWQKKMPRTAGYNLNAAAFNLKAGYAWAHEELGPSGFTASADAESLANGLVGGNSPKKYEVSTTLDAVHLAVLSLSRR